MIHSRILLAAFTCLSLSSLMAQTPIIVAHRGFSHAAPENTLAAFQAAIDIGAPYFELDVQRSADGVPIVLHDETLDKTSSNGSTGRIDRRTAEELLDESVGYPDKFGTQFADESLPTLDQALSLARNAIRVCVEIKVAGIEQAIVESIRSADMQDEVIIFSFSTQVLEAIHKIDPNLPLLFLKEDATAKDLKRAKRLHAEAIGVGGNTRVDADFVAAAAAEGLEVWCWTVDDPKEMGRLAESGVAAIITNRPDFGLELFDAPE